MSSTTKSKKASNSRGTPFKGFINYQPDEQDKREFNERRKEIDLLGNLWARVCEAGYKLSVTYIEQNNCFSASLYATDKVTDYAGFSLSVRAGDPITAAERVIWVHVYKFREDWANQVGDDGEVDPW